MRAICLLVVFYLNVTGLRGGKRSAHDGPNDIKISAVPSDQHSAGPALFSHAESPVWDVHSNSLYFVDVKAQNVHRLDYATGIIHTKHIGYGQVNVVTPVAGSSRLLVAVRAALYLLDWGVDGDAALRLLTSLDEGLPDNVINEAKADAVGRFWAGTKGPPTGDVVVPDRAAFYSIDQNSLPRANVQLKPISISNGMAWAPNNTVMYYIDSPTEKIEAFDYDLAKGEISGRRTILDITQYGYDDAIPDGMTVDSQGNLWVALMFGGTVIQVDPDRRTILNAYKIPAMRTTSVGWGGPSLDVLYVTTGRGPADGPDDPLGGAVFTVRGTGARGLPPHEFRFDNADTY